MRLNQFLARTSGLSRRAADFAISQGRVLVNDVEPQIGQSVTERDGVRLDGDELTLPQQFTYIRFHKPVGVITSHRQQGKTPTVYSLLPESFDRLHTVGRLDRDSSGLLILTDDGDFAHSQTHPSFVKDKVYEVTLSRSLSHDERRLLERGVKLEDGPSRLTFLSHRDDRAVVKLTEGRNRQIRRTFAAVGHEVIVLHRTKFGGLELGDLAPGTWEAFVPGGKKS